MMFLKQAKRYNLTALVLILALFIPAAISTAQPVVLWDQTDMLELPTVGSNNFIDEPEQSFRAADDFQIAGPDKWVIQTVNAFGRYNFPGSADSIDVIFFADNQGVPGEPVQDCQYLNIQPENILDPNFVINLPEACVLGPGHYWVSVQANSPTLNSVIWFWETIDEVILNIFAYENPGGASIPACPTWMPYPECISFPTPGLSFQLLGETMPFTRSIPTLSQWGLIAAAGALGLLGAFFVRRKRLSY